MRIMFILFGLCVVSSCATKFDNNNYERLVSLVVDTRDSQAVCSTSESINTTLSTVKSIAITAMENSAGRDDVDIHDMLVNFVDETQRFQNRIFKGPISATYCQNKIKNLNDTARIIEQAEGEKLRS